MPKYENFEVLPVWQEAARLYHSVLDLLQEPGLRLSPCFRNQLERAALSVSNNIAEGFERVTTNELNSFLAIARGSAGEVRSMVALIAGRPEVTICASQLRAIQDQAQSCARQLTAWTVSNDNSPIQGKRHLNREKRQDLESARKAQLPYELLRSLTPQHPLYNTAEARAARLA